MKENKLKIITIILLIVLVTMVSFFGVYTQEKNKMVNSTKDYQYGMDIDSSVVYTLALDEGDEENKTAENYNKVKSIIENRLNDINKNITQQYENNPSLETTKIKTEDYQVTVNEDTGDIIVTLPKNDNSYYLSSVFTQSGKFEVADADSDEVLLDKSDVESSTLQTYTYGAYTAVSFRIEFNKQGKDKIQTIKENYGENASAEETATTSETAETTTESNTEKKLALKINGEEVYSATLNEFLTNDAIVLSIGEATNEKANLKSALAQGQTLISVLSNDELPLTYKIQSSTVVANTEKDDITGVILIFTAFLWLIVLVFFVIRYKKKGLLASVAFMGFIALFLLLIRYFNVTISTEGIVAVFIIALLNIGYLDSLVKKLVKEENNKKVELKHIINMSVKEMAYKIIPLFILAVVFTFTNKTPANSFGMVMFWGLALILLYNLFVTKELLKYKSQKREHNKAN